MLAIPSFRKLNDLTVYQDDAIWTRFYLVPSTPTIRRDENGRPVFLLSIIHIDPDGEGVPGAPRGAGFMNFDVQFTVDNDATESARSELQKWVDEEYVRRRANPKYSALPEYAATASPRVELNDPLLSGGKVTMHTTQSGLLVADRLAEAPASLVSGSTAVFNMDLTETGAGFMHELFMGTSGEGRLDLTPVQVIYDLKMWARLPPVVITVTGDSERIHHTLVKVSETNRDNPCTPAEVETYRENGTNSSTLKETGAVKVTIDKGDAMVPDDVLEALQQYALDLFDTMVKERFLVPAEKDSAALDFDDDAPGIGERDPGWAAILYAGANYSGAQIEVTESVGSLGSLNDNVGSLRVRSGHRLTLYSHANFGGTSREFTGSVSQLGGSWSREASSARVTRPPTSRYKVRETLNQASMHLEIKLDRSQVVEWPTGGQATLETFFAGASRQELQRHLVELTADSFKSLGVTVRPMVNFDTQPVQALEVQTEYSARDANGRNHTTPGSFTFRSGEAAPAKFDPTIIRDQLEYRFRYRIIYDDGTASDYTAWEATTNRSLNVAVATLGKLELEASGASLNWEILRAVRVDFTYSDPADGAASLQKSFELTKLTPVRKWEQTFNRAIRGSVTSKVTYFLADEKVVEGPTQTIPSTSTLFIVPPPQADVLNVSLVPAGNWSDVAQVVVSMEYAAGDGRVYDKNFRFTALDQIAEWAVLLRDPSRRTFRYRTVITYKSGGAEEVPWVTKTGDQAVIINVAGSPKLRVNVLSNLVDFARTPVVTVTLAYGDERKTLSFTAPGANVWEVPAVAGQKAYTYEITWHPANGNSISSGPHRTENTELFIPRASLPTVGKLDVIIRGFAVDFSATPFVDVALVWKNGSHEARKTVTLSKEQPNAAWSVDIGDNTQRKYRYAITYNLADGTRANGAQGETDDPVLSITRP